MLKNSLLYLSGAGWARWFVTHFPLARKVALRFVAGETMEAALEVSRNLNEQNLLVTLDYLGESVAKAEDTEEVVQAYSDLLREIHERNLQASVSLKLTHLGLDIAEDLCVTNLRKILTVAQENGDIPVTIDMESTHYTDVTLRIYRTMRDEYEFKNVGTVIQAYLYRSEDDLKALSEEGAHIRLCKGAYLEPPKVAFPEKADVDANYIKLIATYLNQADDSYLCFATHDENMIQAAHDFTTNNNIPQERYEYQMLYGVRSSRQLEIAETGEKMRVYVPFGVAWYPYFMRRLAERPANLWFFARSLFG